eukprot:TRINITY_DN6594_c0_g1_i2.p1 TRINITY_DN6594_c0_g1~~TRINITY_DN6594_c0_g1_i2.p1  ORF type:complete len:575 (-),score=87.52 TRINITY_DN6594_c0_g1_i2:90-1814(-)
MAQSGCWWTIIQHCARLGMDFTVPAWVRVLFCWLPLLAASALATVALVVAAVVRAEEAASSLLTCSWLISVALLAGRLIGRLVELACLFAPLPFLRLAALAADSVWPSRPSEGNRTGGCHDNSWASRWWAYALSNLQRSGPVFVKLGQWAATRPDLVPEAWCKELEMLHDSTTPHSFEHTNRVLNASFPEPNKWSNSFLLEPSAKGSGCIAQVYVGMLQQEKPRDSHRGTPTCFVLRPWELFWPRQAHKCASSPSAALGPSACRRDKSFRAIKTAVKVVHPQVRRAVDLDLRFLQAAAWIADKLGFESLGVSLALRQFVKFLLSQSDFRVEAQNLKLFGENFRDSEIIVPPVYDRWVARDVLLMGFQEGEPLTTLLDTEDPKATPLKLDAWDQLVNCVWTMIFKHRFVHGDMHPGNILWRPTGKGSRVQLVLIDCGLAIDLRGDAGEDLSMMLRSLLIEEPEDVARLLMKLGERVGGRMEDVIDPEGFVNGIAGLIKEAKGCAFNLDKLNCGALMARSLFLGRYHRVRFDARFVNLMVAMMVLQGVSLRLYPEGDMMAKMRPYLLGAAVSAVTG